MAKVSTRISTVFLTIVMVATLQALMPREAAASQLPGDDLYVPITISPDSFNRDAIMEEGGSAEPFTEGGTAYALYSQTGQAGSLPADGKIWTSDTSWFQLADYAGNNVRRTLGTAGLTVDIAEESQKEYTDVAFLITGSYVEDPHTKFRVRLHFIDAEGNPQIRDSEQFTLYNYNSNHPEWGANSAFSGGCYGISDQAYNPGREAHLYAYQMHIPGSGETPDYSGCKLTGVEIREITMSKSYDGQVSTLNLFAVSGLERDPSYFQVKFDASGGALDADKDTIIGKVDKDITLPNATWAGYKLAGWYEDDDEDAVVGKAGDAYTVEGNVILKAKWEEADDVTVSFDGNGGTGSMEDVAVTYNSSYTLPENEFGSPEDPYMYNFGCWNVDGKEYKPGDKITVSADTTVKAVWNVRYWGLWVENIHVSGKNHKDILAEHDKPGIVSYDPEANALTLDNATIEIVPYANNGDVEAGIRYNAQQDEYKAMPFTIKLVGQNRIVNEVIDEGADDYQMKMGVLAYDCMDKTIITGDGSLDISMEGTPGQTSGGKDYQYWGIYMHKHAVVDGTTININITDDGAQARGFEMHYTNTLSLENGAKLAISTGGHETSYGMWADRAGKLYSVDEKSVLEVASGNLAFNSIYITDNTAKLSALVNTEPTASGAKIWDGETDLNSEEAGYKYIRIPGDHECADYIDPATVKYSWSGDNSKVTATGTCKVCGENVTETVNTTAKVTKEPTTTAEGVKTYTATFTKNGFKTQTKTESIPKLVKQRWIRLKGTTAYDTMQSIVKEGWKQTGGTVIVATGEGFADALAAAGIAGLENAPILTTTKKSLSAQTRTELNRLKPKNVIIVGGRGAVSTDVENAIKGLSFKPTVTRHKGAEAFNTANAMNLAYKGKWSDTAILATSKGYADALSAAPIAYSQHMPIFLVKDKNSLDAETISTMKSCGIKTVMVVGGRGVVSDDVRSKVAKAGFTVDTRKGASQYDTSLEVAKWGLALGLSADKMGVATGRGYADALAGAALCGQNNAVLVLADKDNHKTCLPVASDNKASISYGYVYGGKAAVPHDVQNAYEKASGCPVSAASQMSIPDADTEEQDSAQALSL